MWEKLVYSLLAIESLLLLYFIFEWVRKKTSRGSFLFLLLAYVINVALCLLPFLYKTQVMGDEIDMVIGVAECFTLPLKAFVGEGTYKTAAEFAKVIPAFRWAYPFGIVLALLATVNAAMQAFSHTLRNGFRLFFALKRKTCDIVVGTSENALRYAKGGAAIVIPDNHLDKTEVLSLIEQGYIVWQRALSKTLLESSALNSFCNYNIICPGNTEQNLDHINSFIEWRKAGGSKKVKLFVEIEAKRAGTIRREMLDKSCCKEAITTFCSNELLARKFTEEHPITEYMPVEFLEEDTSIRDDAELHVIYLGFGALNREMYRQSVINNQVVTFKDGEYQLHPVQYHLFDVGIDEDDWILGELEKAMEKLSKNEREYYPLPPLPYKKTVYNQSPLKRDTLTKVEKLVSAIKEEKTSTDNLEQKNTPKAFFQIIVDVGDTYQNIEVGTRLRMLLNEKTNYHIFIRSESVYTENDNQITYLGDIDDIFNHETIVNDGLAKIAYTLNAIYTHRDIVTNEKRTPCPKEVREKAERDWNEMNHFKRHSNIYAALNMRLKLQLMGLDYVKRAASDGENESLLAKYYSRNKETFTYSDYLKQSTHSALLAQEKYRWNAYHLLEEILPRKRELVQWKEDNGKLKKTTYDKPLTNHACITTFSGIDAVSRDLAEKRGILENKTYDASDFDFYQFDDLLLFAVTELMDELGYSLIQRGSETPK